MFGVALLIILKNLSVIIYMLCATCFWMNCQNIVMMNLNNLLALSSVTKDFYFIRKQIGQHLSKTSNCMIIAWEWEREWGRASCIGKSLGVINNVIRRVFLFQTLDSVFSCMGFIFSQAFFCDDEHRSRLCLAGGIAASKREWSFPVVSAKVLGLGPIGWAWITYKFLNQSQWQGGMGCCDLLGGSQVLSRTPAWATFLPTNNMDWECKNRGFPKENQDSVTKIREEC